MKNEKYFFSILPLITIIGIIFFLFTAELCKGSGNYALGCTGVGIIYLFLLSILLLSVLTLLFIVRGATPSTFVYGMNTLLFVGGVVLLINLSFHLFSDAEYKKQNVLKEKIDQEVASVYKETNNSSKILLVIKHITSSNQELKEDERWNLAELYLALYLQDHDIENLNHSYQEHPSLCYTARNLLKHYQALPLNDYEEIFTFIKDTPHSHKVYPYSCLPFKHREVLNIHTLLHDGHFKLAELMLDGARLDVSESLTLLEDVTTLKKDQDHFRNLVLMNYYYGNMYSNKQRVRELLKLYPIVMQIKDYKNPQLLKNLVINNRSFLFYNEYKEENCKDTSEFLEFKEALIQLRSVITQESILDQEIPTCAKKMLERQ